MPPVTPLSGHAILLFLLQISALLAVARFGAELVRRLGLPTVVGELAAGILLGPTVFGHYFPAAFTALFPPISEQFHLLEIISWLGMVLLLLSTGLETDVRLLRNLGRTALGASLFGMVVPFVFGFGLGWWMPESYVAAPEHRTLFSLFLATAMSISAMPVIAKILLDLDLTRRNIGVVILSAGVVDDTTGWIILSLIAGVATTGNPDLQHLAISIGGTAAFVFGVAFVLFPVLKFAFRVANERFESKDTDLVLLILVTLLFSAATEALKVHAVFGAFVAGCAIRQVPHVREETLHKLEAVTFSIFAPIFFGMVGLKVDLWHIESFDMLLIVLGVATAGKLVGVSIGSMLGGLRFWEAFSIAVAMNARGAMELVVATIGLSLGILNAEMFSIVVMVAVITSFMAPLLLRLTVRMVRVTEEEMARMAADEARGLFDPERVRVLVPTAGGPNAIAASRIGLRVASRSAHSVVVLYVERTSSFWSKLSRLFVSSPEGTGINEHLDQLRAAVAAERLPAPEIRRQSHRDVVDAIAQEAGKGYDLMVVGASGGRHAMRGEKLEKIIAGASCHVAIVRHRGPGDRPFRRILVPVDGSFFSRAGVEFAVRYAEGVGEGAEVTLMVVVDGTRERSSRTPSSFAPTVPHAAVGVVGAPVGVRVAAGQTGGFGGRSQSLIMMADSLQKGGGLEKLSPVFKATKVKTRVMVRQTEPGSLPTLTEARSGKYDLVVVGAENRAIHYRLFFGYDTERLVDESPITVALVVPRVRGA
jgi:Kef-type K+ transport system membrane component KefB/nucleotide-binding universal stress UspA family protein